MWLQTIRDIVIIFVGLADIILFGILIVIAFLIWRMLVALRKELPPVFSTVKKTATTVEGTTDFIATTVAMPLIRAVSLVFAISRFFQVLLSRGNSTSESRS